MLWVHGGILALRAFLWSCQNEGIEGSKPSVVPICNISLLLYFSNSETCSLHFRKQGQASKNSSNFAFVSSSKAFTSACSARNIKPSGKPITSQRSSETSASQIIMFWGIHILGINIDKSGACVDVIAKIFVFVL